VIELIIGSIKPQSVHNSLGKIQQHCQDSIRNVSTNKLGIQTAPHTGMVMIQFGQTGSDSLLVCYDENKRPNLWQMALI
jgi:hypothetical protein